MSWPMRRDTRTARQSILTNPESTTPLACTCASTRLSWEFRNISRRSHSIYLRLLIPLGAALLVAMFVAWSIALYLLTSTIDRRLDAKLENATAILAEGTFPFSADLIARLDRMIEAHIILVDEAGTVGLSTGDEAVNHALADVSEEISTLSGGDALLVTVSSDGVHWRAAARSLERERDSRFRYVVAAAPLAETRKVARDSALLLGLAMLVASAVLALLGSFFTRSITGPIAELAGMADRIAEGERQFSAAFKDGDEIGVLAQTLTDMATRLESYETELAHQSRLSGLGDLAARMAHEIRNPLTAIKMQLQLLEERVDDADGIRVRQVLDEIRRLELIVESALVLGGPLDLEPVSTDPAQVIDEVADLLGPALEHRGITLETAITSLPRVMIDAGRMKQVLLNLINNAADELPAGGEVLIGGSMAGAGTSIELTVADSGPGVSSLRTTEQQRKPFSLGLGLTICQEIVEGHDGELIIGRSEKLGGACFTIRLPASIIDTEPA
jgi:signal transduction histidine kinase